MTITAPRTCAIAALLASALALAGCATNQPAPTLAMQAAAQTIYAADQARAGESAAVELAAARDKLAAAKAAVAKRDMVAGQRLAEQSKVDAEFAMAKAELAKASAVNLEMQKSNHALDQELQRNAESGAHP